MSDSSTELAALFLDVIPQALRHFRKEMRQSRGLGLTLQQFRVLAHLFYYGQGHNCELAEQQGVSVAAMSRLVDGLSKQNLVEKLQYADDRRKVKVRLTALGRRRFKAFQNEARERLEKRFATLKTPDRQKLGSGLSALAAACRHLN